MSIEALRRRAAARGMRLFARRTVAPAQDAPALPAAGIATILVCRTSHSLGNTLLVTPLLREIAAIWPAAQVDIVTRSAVAQAIFTAHANVRNVYSLPRRAFRHPWRTHAQLGAIRAQRYDLAIDTDPRSQTARAILMRCAARCKLGFRNDAKPGDLSHAVDGSMAPRHNGQFPVYLLRAALGRAAATYPPLDLCLGAAERENGARILAALAATSAQRSVTSKGVIGIFANATGPKLQPHAWWDEFMPVIAAAYPGFALIEIVPHTGESMFDRRYPAYFSTNLRELASVLSQLSLLICLDCGIMHLARAAGTKTAAIFNVTDPEEWAPYGEGAHVIRGDGQPATQIAYRLVGEVPASALSTAG